jgi:hypothetical protein
LSSQRQANTESAWIWRLYYADDKTKEYYVALTLKASAYFKFLLNSLENPA